MKHLFFFRPPTWRRCMSRENLLLSKGLSFTQDQPSYCKRQVIKKSPQSCLLFTCSVHSSSVLLIFASSSNSLLAHLQISSIAAWCLCIESLPEEVDSNARQNRTTIVIKTKLKDEITTACHEKMFMPLKRSQNRESHMCDYFILFQQG